MWRAFELRPREAPPLPPEYRARIEAARPRLYRMAQEQYGLEINEGTFGIDSRRALIGEKFAQAQGKGDAYHRAVMRAYWQQALDISGEVVLRSLAVSVGLDGDAFDAALDDPVYIQAMMQDVRTAYRASIQGVPALLFRQKYLVSGAQPYEMLAEIVTRLDSGDLE